MRIVLWLSAFLVVAPLAQAQSLKIRQVQRDESVALQDSLSSVNEQCEAKLTADFDWAGFQPEDYEGSNSINGYCSAALDAVRDICTDPLGKEAIQQQLTRITCARGPHEIRLEGGVLTYVIDWPATNVQDQIKEYLLNKLQ